jgi:hypothetical protein
VGLRFPAPAALSRYYQGGGVIGSGIGSAGAMGKSAVASIATRAAIAASLRLNMVRRILFKRAPVGGQSTSQRGYQSIALSRISMQARGCLL